MSHVSFFFNNLKPAKPFIVVKAEINVSLSIYFNKITARFLTNAIELVSCHSSY